MTPIDQLKSVLCDSEGKCCITGSDEDRAIVDRALEALAQPVQEPWVGLTDDEKISFSTWLDHKEDHEVFAAIEAKLKEKNT